MNEGATLGEESNWLLMSPLLKTHFEGRVYSNIKIGRDNGAPKGLRVFSSVKCLILRRYFTRIRGKWRFFGGCLA